MTAYEALQACEARESHAAHLAAHREVFANPNMRATRRGVVTDVVVPYVEWDGNRIPLKGKFDWWLRHIAWRFWFSWGPV